MVNKTKAIEKYGRAYVDRFLKEQIADRESIYNDRDKALEFFFSKSFFRGRRDELSERFRQAALKTLREQDLGKKHDQAILDNRLGENGVNNHKDRRMVLETLDFIFNLDSFGNNIVRYAVDQIKVKKIAQVFQALVRIYAVGDKLASLYLRDVALVYHLEEVLKPDELGYCQPIDTWVRQVASKLGIITSNGTTETIKSSIIKACLDAQVSPLLFNAGAWIVGAKSFDLLLERL